MLLKATDPNLARQNPADYIDGLRASVTGALSAAERTPGFSRRRVIGIGVDTTGSTPLPVDGNARPLALDPRWQTELLAHAWLWKDHTASAEAAEITELAKRHAPGGPSRRSAASTPRNGGGRNLALSEGGAGCVPRGGELGRARRLHSGVARRREQFRNNRALGVRRRAQGDVFGQLGRAGRQDVPGAARPEYRRASRSAVRRRVAAGTTGRSTLCRVGEAARSPRRHGHRDGRLRRSLRRCRIGHRAGHAGEDHRHVDVRLRRQPARLRWISSRSGQARRRAECVEIPGMCGIVEGSILPGCFGSRRANRRSAICWVVRGNRRRRHQGRESGLSKQTARLRPGQSGLLALDWNNGNRTFSSTRG